MVDECGGFEARDLAPAWRRDELDPRFPTSVQTWSSNATPLPAHGSTFCYAHDGIATLACASGTFQLRAGMYACVPGEASIEGGRGIAITRDGWRGLFHLGGPVEATGRLRYIDGCTDSLIVPPVVRGDACLNLLHIPPGTEQTQHTHPSVRVGVIASGYGICRTPDGDADLSPGLAFVIPPGGVHSFHTRQHALRVIAYHPDSDCGPDHRDHPMVNRTIVDGVSARDLPHLSTRERHPAEADAP